MLTQQIQLKHLSQLKNTPLSLLVQICKANIIKYQILSQIQARPLEPQILYLYLNKMFTKQAKDNELIELLNEFIIEKESIFIKQDENSLPKDIIEKIASDVPSLILNFTVVIQSNKNQNLIEISAKNIYGVTNVVLLAIKKLYKSDQNQLKYILQNILFPVYFYQIVESLQSQIIQQIKMINDPQKISIISQILIQYYQSFWIDNRDRKSQKYIENHLSLIEAVYSNRIYPLALSESKILIQHMLFLLHYVGENKGPVHLLAVNIFQKISKRRNMWNDTCQIFVNIFNTLSCFGSHLIKDVWKSIYLLIDKAQNTIISQLDLIDVLLLKLENHQNSNVIKNCLHQLLQNNDNRTLFYKIPQIIYGALIRMLNLGVHYQDCLFHMDSKMYPLISRFFFNFYNACQNHQTLSDHIRWLLSAILQRVTFDHTLIALLKVFDHQTKQTTILGEVQINRITGLMIKQYHRFPIRKRYQLVDSLLSLLSKNLNHAIFPQQIMKFISGIPLQYLNINIHKVKQLIEVYSKSRIKQYLQILIAQVRQNIKIDINFRHSNFKQSDQIIKKIIIADLIQRVLQQPQTAYLEEWLQITKQYGQSLYKSTVQRYFFIQSISKILPNLLFLIPKSKQFVVVLDWILNNLTLYLPTIDQPTCEKEVKEIVELLSMRVYGKTEIQQFSERQGQRMVLSKLVEWCYDQINTNRLAWPILITILEARNKIIRQKRQNVQQYQNYQNLFQQTLYKIYDDVFSNDPKSLNQQQQLKLQVLIISILINDPSHISSIIPPSFEQFQDAIDRYDYQSYQHVCWLIEAVYCRFEVLNSHKIPIQFQQRMSQIQACHISKCLQTLLNNMIDNLQYGLSAKQIIPLVQCTINIFFTFAISNQQFSPSLSGFIFKIFEIGQNFLIFQRSATLYFTKHFDRHFHQIININSSSIYRIILKIITIEEYRGFDSSIYLHLYQEKIPFYSKAGYSLQSDYTGVSLRFAFIQLYQAKMINYSSNQKANLFFEQIMMQCLQICFKELEKEKMFLSGNNKLKLQTWQFLLCYPLSFFTNLPSNSLHQLIIRCINSINQNSISQVRYYSELFFLRILMRQQHFKIITDSILNLLKECVFSSIGNINKNVTFMVIAGLVIKHIIKMSQFQCQYFEIIKPSFVNLYNSLLTYVGSSVAYFRGLSQYFCLQTKHSAIDTPYVEILRSNYLQDIDALRLKQKLTIIVDDTLSQIYNWNIKKEILSKLPTNNNNVVSNHYHMDRMKKLGQELVKTNKGDDGFIAYKDMWKKKINQSAKENDFNDQEQINIQQDEEQNVFQRKIDPTLDYIYNQSEKQSHLKILVASTKSDVLLGHLARTGQIMGLQQLIIPSLKILEDQKFKSIAVTAERWLKITDLQSMKYKSRQKSIIATIIKHKSEDFQIILFTKGIQKEYKQIKLNYKCLLIIDELNILQNSMSSLIDCHVQIRSSFSLHVQASIVIWQYMKNYLHEK